jgi:hypothetical protein
VSARQCAAALGAIACSVQSLANQVVEDREAYLHVCEVGDALGLVKAELESIASMLKWPGD